MGLSKNPFILPIGHVDHFFTYPFSLMFHLYPKPRIRARNKKKGLFFTPPGGVKTTPKKVFSPFTMRSRRIL